jgi:hypothetical protein
MGKSIKTNALIGEYFWENNSVDSLELISNI